MGDFIWRLDVASTMVMKGRAEPGRIAHHAGNTLGSVYEDLPLLLAQAHLCGDAPGIACADRLGPIGIGQNEQWSLGALTMLCDCGEQLGCLQDLGLSAGMVSWIFQGYR